MWHLPRTMVILNGMSTCCWVNIRKMRWPHDLPYPVMMIMGFHSLHETHETYDHIQLRSLGTLPSCWLDVQTVLSFFPCHHSLWSTFIFLFVMPSSYVINILFPLLLYLSSPSKWSYNIVEEYIYKPMLPTIDLL